METLVIHFGGNKPAKAKGKHQCNLLRFAYDYPGLHSYYSKCRTTKRVVQSLAKREMIIHYPETSQFEWNKQFGK